MMFLIKKELHKVRNLVYTVNPLPHSLLNFVFDFGNLTDEDRVKYIISMIDEPISDYFEDKNCDKCKEIKELAKNMIVTAQNYIKEIYEESSVSLREVRRFVIFFQWFIEYLSKKDSINPKFKYSEKTSEQNDKYIRIIKTSIPRFCPYFTP